MVVDDHKNISEKNKRQSSRMENLLSSLVTTTTTDGLFYNSSTMDLFLKPVLTCSESSGDCAIDHSVVCVGDPEFCNLTQSEYEELLYDYISPTVPEWILIFSHICVFLMGLVSGSSLISFTLRISLDMFNILQYMVDI